MKLFHRARLFAALLPFAMSCGLQAQTFPSQPVRVIVPFPPGGGFDVTTRAVTARMAEALGQPVVVENRAGAGGYLGARLAARAPADGYTLLACGISTHGTGPALHRNPPVDAVKDFIPIGMMGSNPNVLVVNPSLPVKTLADFVAWVRAGGGKLSYATSGLGTAPHLTMEVIKNAYHLDLPAVHYNGDAPTLQAVIGGHVPAMFGGIGTHLGAIKAGLTRPIVVTSLKRDPALPDVPTLAESGLPIEVLSWVGLCAPARTPVPVLDALHAALQKSLDDPETRAHLARLNWEAKPMSRAEFGGYIQQEIARWRKVVEASKIPVD